MNASFSAGLYCGGRDFRHILSDFHIEFLHHPAEQRESLTDLIDWLGFLTYCHLVNTFLRVLDAEVV